MIQRECKLGRDLCRGTFGFEVRYPSDPKEFCAVGCATIAKMRDRSSGAAAADGAKGAAVALEKRQRRVLAFIAGLTPLEVFESGVRLGYARAQKEAEDEPLGEIGRLTREALT